MIPHYEGLKISWCLVVCNHECFQSTSWCLLSILSSKNQFFFVFGTLVPCLCFMFMCLFIFDVLVFFCVCYINIFVFQCFQFVSWCLFCFSWGFFFWKFVVSMFIFHDFIYMLWLLCLLKICCLCLMFMCLCLGYVEIDV